MPCSFAAASLLPALLLGSLLPTGLVAPALAAPLFTKADIQRRTNVNLAVLQVRLRARGGIYLVSSPAADG